MEAKIIEEFGEKVISIVNIAPDDMERYLIWAETDILFITNKRDGLYMSPLEYVIIRHELKKAKKSTVLISEFVGGASLLNGAIKFNPYNIRDMVSNLEKAVSLITPQEKEANFNSLYSYVTTHTIDKWAYRFLRDIKFVHQRKMAVLGNEGRQVVTNKLLMQKKKEIISTSDFIKKYRTSKSRLIIILIDRIKEMLTEG